MKNIILMAGAMILGTGCASLAGPTNMDCEGANGPDIHIRYGDAKINVTNRVRVKPDGRLVIRLHPDRKSEGKVDYKKLDITLEGKDAASQWINTTLNANEKNSSKAVICVENQTPGTYEYLVRVPGVGIIDPRVDVIPLQ